MKFAFNFTTCDDDLLRYPNRKAFAEALEGFDGVELMYLGPDKNKLVQPQQVVGMHLGYFPTWFDFWTQNEEALLREFGSLEMVEQVYGSLDPQILVQKIQDELVYAHAYGAEYVVYHVSESRSAELFSNTYATPDEEVVCEAAKILNAAFAQENTGLTLLCENLWQSGLTFTKPQVTALLMNELTYKHKGIMLDTGHLMHTNLDLTTQDEALAYVRSQVAAHGELAEYVHGMHLQQSLTGEVMKQTMAHPPTLEADYTKRMGQLFEYSFAMDKHQPFCAAGLDELLDDLPQLKWVTFEFMSRSQKEHQRFLHMQRDYLIKTLIREHHATQSELNAWC